MDYYLGLDLGTGSIKTVLFDENGAEIASASQEYPLYQPYNGWSEQDPEDWVRAAVATVSCVMETSGTDPRRVKGLGISGQMSGIVLLDKDGRVLRRAILWNDARTTEACRHLRDELGDEIFMKYSLMPLRPGLPAARIHWVKENEPEIFKKVRHILLPKDYLKYYLTGKFAAEVSDASATQLLDIKNRVWSQEMLSAMELPEEFLGPVYESYEIMGYLLPDVAEDMHLTADCAVAGGAGDNAAAAVGCGVVSAGPSMITVGTSGTVAACNDAPVPSPHLGVYTFCMASPGIWFYMGSVNACGGALKWWRNTFYPNDREYLEIDRDVETSAPGANRLLFLPYLNGEQSPHFNLDLRGSFVGLSSIHNKADMTRAVMEGATYALGDVMAEIDASGNPASHVRMCGGGSKSVFWRQLLSDVLNKPVYLPDLNSENCASLGAAILAMTGTKAYASVSEACEKIIRLKKESYVPDPEKVKIYQAFHQEFDTLYGKLKDEFYHILNL